MVVCRGSELSTTDSANVYVPASVGVPANAPLGEPGVGCWKKSPGGNASVVTEKESGSVPPTVVIAALYGTATMPFGSTVVLITNVFTAIVNVCVAVCVGVEASVTLTVNVKFPGPDGVPVNTLPTSAMPGGNVPSTTVPL